MTTRRTEMMGADAQHSESDTMEEGEGEEMALEKPSGARGSKSRRGGHEAETVETPDNGVVTSGGATSRKI